MNESHKSSQGNLEGRRRSVMTEQDRIHLINKMKDQFRGDLDYSQVKSSWLIRYHRSWIAFGFALCMIYIHHVMMMHGFNMMICACICSVVLGYCSWPYYKQSLTFKSLMWFLPLNVMIASILLGSQGVISLSAAWWVSVYAWLTHSLTWLAIKDKQ